MDPPSERASEEAAQMTSCMGLAAVFGGMALVVVPVVTVMVRYGFGLFGY